MAIQMGGQKEIKLSTAFEYDKAEANIELDLLDGTISSLVSYKLNKEVSLQWLFGFNPLASKSQKNKKYIRNFGIGVKYETNAMEELMKEEEDLSEYEYKNL
jgi:hypothetical protein